MLTKLSTACIWEINLIRFSPSSLFTLPDLSSLSITTLYTLSLILILSYLSLYYLLYLYIYYIIFPIDISLLSLYNLIRQGGGSYVIRFLTDMPVFLNAIVWTCRLSWLRVDRNAIYSSNASIFTLNKRPDRLCSFSTASMSWRLMSSLILAPSPSPSRLIVECIGGKDAMNSIIIFPPCNKKTPFGAH